MIDYTQYTAQSQNSRNRKVNPTVSYKQTSNQFSLSTKSAIKL